MKNCSLTLLKHRTYLQHEVTDVPEREISFVAWEGAHVRSTWKYKFQPASKWHGISSARLGQGQSCQSTHMR